MTTKAASAAAPGDREALRARLWAAVEAAYGLLRSRKPDVKLRAVHATARRLASLEAALEGSEGVCCFESPRGAAHLFAFHRAHEDRAEPRPLPPCRKEGESLCASARASLANPQEAPYLLPRPHALFSEAAFEELPDE